MLLSNLGGNTKTEITNQKQVRLMITRFSFNVHAAPEMNLHCPGNSDLSCVRSRNQDRRAFHSSRDRPDSARPSAYQILSVSESHSSMSSLVLMNSGRLIPDLSQRSRAMS